MRGRQWSAVVAQHADIIGLPTPSVFWRDRAVTYLSMREYRHTLDDTMRDAWLTRWRAAAAWQVHPHPYATLVKEPASLAKACAEQGIDWDVVVGTTSIVRLRTGLIPLGLTASGTPSQAVGGLCAVVAEN